MSQQGPILIVANDERASLVEALEDAKLFPLIEADFAEASRAVAVAQPAAVLVAISGSEDSDLGAIAQGIADRKPYLPLIAVDPPARLPDNAIPFQRSAGDADRLAARLRAALRVRALHMTVLRRLADAPEQADLTEIDPARDATVLLIGRGGRYPALSVALGERMGVVGALSIEAAARHLNTRDLDGIVVAEGFTPRVINAFLIVLSEDARFRNMPIVIVSGPLGQAHDLPNLEVIPGDPADVVVKALPMIRQHALEVQLSRTLRAIDAGGLLDPQTGLMTEAAFMRDFAAAVAQTLSDGGGFSVARFVFDESNPRAQLDGARIISRLMRQTDFGAVQHDGSVIVVFAECELRSAHAIVRRLSSVMRHTSHGRRAMRSEPAVTVATLQPTDSADALLARLYADRRREAV